MTKRKNLNRKQRGKIAKIKTAELENDLNTQDCNKQSVQAGTPNGSKNGRTRKHVFSPANYGNSAIKLGEN